MHVAETIWRFGIHVGEWRYVEWHDHPMEGSHWFLFEEDTEYIISYLVDHIVWQELSGLRTNPSALGELFRKATRDSRIKPISEVKSIDDFKDKVVVYLRHHKNVKDAEELLEMHSTPPVTKTVTFT